MLLEFACQCRGGSIAWCQDNKGLDDLTAHFVGAGNYRRLGNGGVFFQCAFHLEGADTVANADNNIIGSSDEPEVAILVLVGTIPGDVPVATYGGVGCVRVAPVLPEHPGGTLWLHFDGYVTFFVWGKGIAVVVNHLDLEAGRRLAHRTGFYLQGWEVGTQYHSLRLPIAVANNHACALLPRSYYLWIERLARAGAVAQRLRWI